MIVRIAPHLAPPLPRQRAFEPAVCELLDDAHPPSVRPVRIVNALETASNGRGGHLQIDRQTTTRLVSKRDRAPVRRVTVANIAHVQAMIARSTRAAAAAGVFGSARMCFGALDLYVSPYQRVETSTPISTT